MNRPAASAALGSTAPLRIERPRAGVLRLVLDNPPANALSEALLAALQDAVDEAAADAATRVVVIAATGKLFSGGHDLKEMSARRSDPDAGRAYFETVFGACSRLMQSLLALPKPVVAEVAGLATAAGCQLVATCDIAIAADTAKFGVNGIDLGLFCSTPMVALSRNVSPKTALDMLMTGEMISAERALAAGLVSRVVPAAELEAEVMKTAEEIAKKSLPAVMMAKEAVNRAFETTLAEGVRFERRMFHATFATADQKEGMAAFAEKRAPNFTNR
jgi:enoyl-CoA hydratase/carnithine racemase